MPEQEEDLREAVRRRKLWFHECQLRELNYDRFRLVEPEQHGAFLDLVSELDVGVQFQGGLGRLKELPRLYRDSGAPVWTARERAQHDAFAASLLGRAGDWLGHREPRLLAKELAQLRDGFEHSRFGSVLEDLSRLANFPRKPPPDRVGPAISRMELAAARPWLVPELHCPPGSEPTDPGQWVAAMERYCSDFESELAACLRGKVPPPFDPDAPADYRAALVRMLADVSARPASDAVRVELVRRDGDGKYQFEPRLGMARGEPTPLPEGSRVRYWADVVGSSLKECVALKANSDMGLCQLVRILYRYGTLPDALDAGRTPSWRDRSGPGPTYDEFMAARRAAIADDDLRRRFEAAQARLRIILTESARAPRSPDPGFSPLAGEILKQGLLSYKFWLDEHPRAFENERLNAVKAALVDGEDQDKEMEFWSENHYIMFASSEYLLGQLWETDEFQPCREFADPGDATGRVSGARRRARGRARALKWLNNRLMFGWMEFNSSGYYREHLWALLNLVDFALDDEVRTKAEMAVDLLLFDVVRNLHRGSMGAAGGRSQFKSKSGGFDNGLSDVVEILLGAKGMFSEGDAQVAASLASSRYETPLALLEIGAHPPSFPFTERARVSIGFDEAAKYGIRYSQDTESRRAVLRGYAAKRARYSPHLEELNREIERTHEDYTSADDDIVFFWGMSAFVNKQVLQGTKRLVAKFGLEASDAFSTPMTLIKLGNIARGKDVLEGIPGRVLSAFTGDPDDTVDEETADELSVLLEGSTRSRANIVTHHSPGAMLSSLQDFRRGQLNFQSSVQQATLSGAANVFVNAGFGGLDISDVFAFGAGFLVGGVEGGVAGVVLNNELLQDTNPLNPDHADGPDWWTGNWSLPRILQHGGAAIMISDFHAIQEFLAETGSHAWFPRAGFDAVLERRTSGYDDANFALLDIGHIGAKGFWLFGKVVHPQPEAAQGEPEEGYVGVFSNRRPEWLTMDSDPYDHYVEERKEKDDKKAELKGRLDGLPDLFSDKDWYVNDDNVWIVQVGSRSGFGSFEGFVDRVSAARVRLDDAGDLECTYDSPQPGGGSARIRLTDGDEPEFEVNGKPVPTDRFPRFENPFVRGGLVEWQQRAYCIEWNGATLLHDFTDGAHPVRLEQPPPAPQDATTVRALVIHLTSGDEELEAGDIALATVTIGCETAAGEQVVAVGPIAENAVQDAEWIFLDGPLERSPDMTLELFRAGDDPDWEASFSLRALMGDHRVRDCTVTAPNLSFDDDHTRSGPRAFSVRLGQWEPWRPVGGAVEAHQWRLAAQPPAWAGWHDHVDLLVVDRRRRMWHRRMTCRGELGYWQELDARGEAPDLAQPFTWSVVNDAQGVTHVLLLSAGVLFVRSSDGGRGWRDGWVRLRPTVRGILSVFPDSPVPLDGTSVLTASAGATGGLELVLSGADGVLYSRETSHGVQDGYWTRLEEPGFPLAAGTGGRLLSGMVLILSRAGVLHLLDHASPSGASGWQALPSPGFAVTDWAATEAGGRVHVAARGATGEVVTGVLAAGSVVWGHLTAADGWRPAPWQGLVWAATDVQEARVVATGFDGIIRWALPGGVWESVGGLAPGPAMAVAAVTRAHGQAEVFMQAADGSLNWAWWS